MALPARGALAYLAVGLSSLGLSREARAQAPAPGSSGSADSANTPPPFAPRSGAAPGAAPPAPTAPGPVTPPRLSHFVEADYPAEARDAGLTATVVLSLSIDAQGRVTEASVVEGAGHGFDEAAVVAARQFEFAPAQQGTTPIAARIRYRYRFTLRAAPATARAPAAVLRGVVRDERNRALPQATVTIHVPGGDDAQQTTDVAGGFRFELTREGVATVTVAHAGFREFRATEEVHDRDDVQVVYRMRVAPAADAASAGAVRPAAPPADPDEQGVTVRGVRAPREVTRTTLDRREIMRIPGTGGDALRAIQNLPGLARPSFLGGALIVRGASPFDTQVFVDGTTLPLLYHFGGLSSVIQTEMLDRIDFYPGNFSARYGRAMGGVVDVGIRSPRRRGYRAVVNVNLIDASFFIEGAITPELSFSVAGRRSYVDVILNAVLSNVSGVNLTAAPVYYDYQAVLEWRPNARNRVRLFLFGDDDNLEILFRNPSDNAPSFAGRFAVATRFHLGQLLWTHDFSPQTQGRAMVSFGWTNLDLSASEQFRFALQFFPLNARYELSHQLSPAARINAGLDVLFGPASVQFSAARFDANGGGDPSTAQRIASDVNGFQYQPGAYVEAELTPGGGLRVVPGIRLDYNRATRQAELAPRFAFRWDFLRDWVLKGGVGLFIQPPQFNQTSSAPNSFFPGQTIGNPNLLFQRATHYGLGVEHSFSRYVSLSVEGFYKTLDGLVVQAPTITQLQAMPAPPYNNDGIGRIYGMELLLRHRASDRFFGWVAYTLLRSERRDSPLRPNDWYVFDQDQTHILTVLGSYTLGQGWEVGARFRYVTGSPLTPVTGAFYSADSGAYTPINGARNSARVGDFHQLDVRIDKTWRFRTWSLGAYLEVLNVYNQGNPEGVQYNYNYTQSQPITGLPIFPNLGLRGEF